MDLTSVPVHSACNVLRSIPRPQEHHPCSLYSFKKTDPASTEPKRLCGLFWNVLVASITKMSLSNFFADGGSNRVYTIQSTARNYVFRVAFPIDPYYKTEADVTTSELVRHSTTIRVPTI